MKIPAFRFKHAACLLALMFISGLALRLNAVTSTVAGPTIYIEAASGFDTDITAAFLKKKTPVTVVEDKSKADYVLTASEIHDHQESTGSKVARCLLMDCIGVEGNASVSVKMMKSSDQSIVWAYQVRNGFSGPQARQSLSEAIAKHLKEYFDDAAKGKKEPATTAN
jgi:hypothetical protein